MKHRESTTKEITYIALGVATMIAGGIGLYQLAAIMPVLGIKYLFIAPYLSMVLMVLLSKIARQWVLIKVGVIFGLIMLLINLFMGGAIILSTVFAQGSIMYLPIEKQSFWGSSLFSAYAAASALIISKYLIGGVFAHIHLSWIAVVAMGSLLLGMLGALYAKRLLRYMQADIS